MKPASLHRSIAAFALEHYAALGIFALGFLLRFIGSLRTHMVVDEQLWINTAKQISFAPSSFHLIAHGAYHPPFESYLIKFSTLLLSGNWLSMVLPYRTDLFRTRFLHVVLSSLTVLAIYFLAREGFNKRAGIFSAAGVAFCQFHLHFSRTAIQTGSLLFFVTVSFLVFWKAVKHRDSRYLVLLGATLGMGYLCEETAAFLLPVFLLFLIIQRDLSYWLKNRHTWVAAVIFALIIAPDLYWNLTARNSDISYHLARAAQIHGLSLLPSSLFIGELFLILVKDPVAFAGGLGRAAIWPAQYPPMHWVFGVLCLVSVLAALRKRQSAFATLMLIAFAVVFGFFTLFASSGPLGNFNFWWASTCYVPAVVLAGAMLSRLMSKRPLLKYLSIGVVVYLFAQSINFLTISEPVYVRRPAYLARYYLETGRQWLLKGNTAWAGDNFSKSLKYDKTSGIALYNLAECFRREGKELEAEDILRRAKADGLTVRSDQLLDRGYVKNWLVSAFYDAAHFHSDDVAPQFLNGATANPLAAGMPDVPGCRRISSGNAYINLKETLAPKAYGFAFAAADVNSQRNARINLLVGVDDNLTIWVNRKKVYEDHGKHLWFPDEERIPADLNAGRNEVVVCVVYAQGQQYGFSVRIVDEAGNPFGQAETSVEPAGETRVLGPRAIMDGNLGEGN